MTSRTLKVIQTLAKEHFVKQQAERRRLLWAADIVVENYRRTERLFELLGFYYTDIGFIQRHPEPQELFNRSGQRVF